MRAPPQTKPTVGIVRRITNALADQCRNTMQTAKLGPDDSKAITTALAAHRAGQLVGDRFYRNLLRVLHDNSGGKKRA